MPYVQKIKLKINKKRQNHQTLTVLSPHPVSPKRRNKKNYKNKAKNKKRYKPVSKPNKPNKPPLSRDHSINNSRSLNTSHSTHESNIIQDVRKTGKISIGPELKINSSLSADEDKQDISLEEDASSIDMMNSPIIKSPHIIDIISPKQSIMSPLFLSNAQNMTNAEMEELSDENGNYMVEEPIVNEITEITDRNNQILWGKETDIHTYDEVMKSIENIDNISIPSNFNYHKNHTIIDNPASNKSSRNSFEFPNPNNTYNSKKINLNLRFPKTNYSLLTTESTSIWSPINHSTTFHWNQSDVIRLSNLHFNNQKIKYEKESHGANWHYKSVYYH